MECCKVSFIIPVYNSSGIFSKNIGYLIENLRNLNIPYEIIVIDDGSKDSEKLAETINKLSLTLITHPENKGKGAALRSGFQIARGDIQIFTDPDIPYMFEAVKNILELLNDGKTDMVIGNRLSSSSSYYQKIGLTRKLGSRFVSFFLGTFITKGIFDTQCGLKGFTKEAIKTLLPLSRIDRFAIDTELIYLALQKKLSIYKIPVTLRSVDGNTVRVIRDGIQFLKDVITLMFRKQKLKAQEMHV